MKGEEMRETGDRSTIIITLQTNVKYNQLLKYRKGISNATYFFKAYLTEKFCWWVMWQSLFSMEIEFLHRNIILY